MLVFGPIPSRRLGYSLGINHIPPKHCPYACVYCQVGRTTHMEIERSAFFPFNQILVEVENKISQCSHSGVSIDYLTLVPDGEPTLDQNLGKLIQELKKYAIPVAVISNSSLIDRSDVQDELLLADWVSLKVDSVDEQLWRSINRPHKKLSLENIMQGMLEFRNKFSGIFVTETMLISGINDIAATTQRLCDFLLELQPSKSYLAIPIRPPAKSGVCAPSAESLQGNLQICSDRLPFIDMLFETEIGDFVSTGNLKDDILSITAVHPLREKALRQMVLQAGENWNVVASLIQEGKITAIKYRDEEYFLHCQP